MSVANEIESYRLEEVCKDLERNILEDLLWRQIEIVDLPSPERQYKFHPNRRWPFDFCWPSHKLAVEVQGGIYKKNPGRHNRGPAMEREYEKLNTALLMGWRVMLFGPVAIRNGEALTFIEKALAVRPSGKPALEHSEVTRS